MKKLAILSGAVVAGLMAFSPASAGPGVNVGPTVLLYTDAGTPMVTQISHGHRKARRKIRRKRRTHRRHGGIYYAPHDYYAPHARRDYRHWSSYYGWHDHRGHRRRGNYGFYFQF